MPNLPVNQLPLAPLGAGDLIDRAVRLYRQHLFTLIRIAAPPVIISTIGSVLFTIAWRRGFTTDSGTMLALYVLEAIGGVFLIISGHIFSLLVMGGVARNLVTHLLWNHPVTVRTTYAAVRSRFWSLVAGIDCDVALGAAFSFPRPVWLLHGYGDHQYRRCDLLDSFTSLASSSHVGGRSCSGSCGRSLALFLFCGTDSLCAAGDVGRR